jgi:hypothetical protein
MKEFQRLHGAFPPGRSQNREDDYILAYFGDFVGRFLDVGAMDGITISNTYALAQKGWKGVCVEPDPQALEGLQRTHGDNPNIVIAPVAISTCGKVPDVLQQPQRRRLHAVEGAPGQVGVARRRTTRSKC